MICFPHAKINIGLRIVEKRSDGFHNIETVFYPIHGLYDCLEIHQSQELHFTNTGLEIDAPIEKNLCVRAWHVLNAHTPIPPIAIHLHKHIPFGAGLGGGSADAAFVLTALNSYFNLQLSIETLEQLALQLGSDCPFFIQSTPVFAEGRGEVFSPCSIKLTNYFIVLANPNIHVSTAMAYAGVSPHKRPHTMLHDLSINPAKWKGVIENDFEASVFQQFPAIQELKETMYNLGAVYAAMSGSGSTVFGIFESEIEIPTNIPVIWKGRLL
ncbi:MAG TPA: 4-(cytidine 5'-diphospho)-2-C-methyl-D-erythritol kinase [Bacteroidales bacterium]|nr:4-(cytidine 5'-diphospho)-2-C-methyl-D-erythritol kinase [Bacteroidales bacterium]